METGKQEKRMIDTKKIKEEKACTEYGRHMSAF